jgi:hypothetical protein
VLIEASKEQQQIMNTTKNQLQTKQSVVQQKQYQIS